MEFLDRLKKVCEQHGFDVSDRSQPDPEVVILHDICDRGVSWHGLQLEKILAGCADAGDTVLIAGAEGTLAIPGAFQFLHYYVETLIKKRVLVCGNDSNLAAGWDQASRRWLQLAHESGRNEEILAAMNDNERVIQERIRSLIDGSRGLSLQKGRSFQVISDHPLAAALQEKLEQRSVRCAVAATHHPPPTELVVGFHEALELLHDGDDQEKISALGVIASTPVRRALWDLHEASRWPKHSPSVQNHARDMLNQLISHMDWGE